MSSPDTIKRLENDPNNWTEGSADSGLKYFFNTKVSFPSQYSPLKFSKIEFFLSQKMPSDRL
jgi:hypothetical protein